MASTNSSVGITINIVCKEVQYDFSDFPDYDFIRQAAISAVQKEYAERQREEDEEIEDMLNDGSLSSADDFDRAYGEPFDPNKCEQRIVEVHDMETMISASLIAKHIGIECDDKAAYGLLGIMKDRLSQQSMEIGRREMFTTAYDRATALFKQFYKAFDKEFSALEKQRETEKAKAEVAASITDKVSDVPLITCEGAKAREAGIIEDWRKSKAENGAVIDAVRKSITANSTYLNGYRYAP